MRNFGLFVLIIAFVNLTRANRIFFRKKQACSILLSIVVNERQSTKENKKTNNKLLNIEHETCL